MRVNYSEIFPPFLALLNRLALLNDWSIWKQVLKILEYLLIFLCRNFFEFLIVSLHAHLIGSVIDQKFQLVFLDTDENFFEILESRSNHG